MRALAPLIRRPLAFVAALSFFINLLLLAPALFMLLVFDRVLSSRSQETLGVLLLGMSIALATMLALDYLRSRLQGVAGSLLSERLSVQVAKVILEQNAKGGEQLGAESLRDIATLRNLFSAQGLIALLDTPWTLIYVAVIWLAHPTLGMAAAGAAVIMLGLAVLNDHLTRRDIASVQQETLQSMRYLESSLRNAEVVQSLGMGTALLGRWHGLNASAAALQSPLAIKSAGIAAFTRTIRQAVQVLIQGLGAYLVITGQGTPGILVASTILLARALSPVEQLVGSWRSLTEGRLAWDRVSQLLKIVESEPQRMALPQPTGVLQANGLIFRLPKSEQLILAGVSLHLAVGESLAVVGPSGAGKSTLIRLLTGLCKPTLGVVRLDHVDLAQWPRKELGPWLGYVPQDVELFAGTVAENIARVGEVHSELVVKAAKRAGIHELVLALPNGYETQVVPDGKTLSPGQRQRIALARALYGDPKLLVLDEPNSNLDGAGERALALALREMKGHVTVVVVTHRSSLVQQVDKLLVLEAGRVQHYGDTNTVLHAMSLQSGKGGQVVPIQQPSVKPQVDAATSLPTELPNTAT